MLFEHMYVIVEVSPQPTPQSSYHTYCCPIGSFRDGGFDEILAVVSVMHVENSAWLVMSLDLITELMLSAAEGQLRKVAEQRQSHLGLLRFCRSIASAALHEVSRVGHCADVGKSFYA
jgi:hypothetical protein